VNDCCRLRRRTIVVCNALHGIGGVSWIVLQCEERSLPYSPRSAGVSRRTSNIMATYLKLVLLSF
jgi:hypothetical protein